MISLIWKYYADPVTVVPSKWISPLERLVAFPSGVAGKDRWISNKTLIYIAMCKGLATPLHPKLHALPGAKKRRN